MRQIPPRHNDLGHGMQVRRLLPHQTQRSVGPFVFFDHMGPVILERGDEMVVRAHPHIGLSTLTWLFSGHIMHRDSLGYEQLVSPGEINWMTAGHGIAHSERSEGNRPAQKLEGIQIWIALPVEYEECEPSFEHYSASQIPKKENSSLRHTLIAGEALGLKSPVKAYSPLFYCQTEFLKPQIFVWPRVSTHETALYVLEGEVVFGEQSFSAGTMLTFEPGEELKIEVLSTAKVLFFGGEPFREPRHIWWNLVSSSRESIEEAKVRWKNDDFGTVINESERIPLPES